MIMFSGTLPALKPSILAEALYFPSPLLNSLIYSFLSTVIDKDLLSPSKLFTFDEIFIVLILI